MSLEGKATGEVLRGRINAVKVIHEDAYTIAVKNGFEGTIDEWLESLKGEKGDDGVSVEYFGCLTPSMESGGVNSFVLELSDGTQEFFQIMNGEKGDSPVRGTDYWTAADIAEIKSYVDEAILGGAW
jgi:hypothetical protein